MSRNVTGNGAGIGIDVAVIGTCSICGGAVTLPKVWMSTKKPIATCNSCGAVDARGHGPTIPMVKRT